MSDCAGYRIDGNDVTVRVHCNGCADAAALREQLAEAKSDVERSVEAADVLTQEEVLLRITAESDLAAEQRAHDATRARLATAESLALTNGERVTRAEALLREWLAVNICSDRDVQKLERRTSAFMAPAPTEPDGASETKETR